jgi:hypothetical protein
LEVSSLGVVEEGGIKEDSPAGAATDPSSFFLFFRSEPPIFCKILYYLMTGSI